MKNKGLSEKAVQVEVLYSKLKKWTRKKKRPRRFRKKQYGLIVHTTGSGITSRAVKKGLGPEGLGDLCVKHYLGSGGTHYLASYNGMLIQLANDSQLAYGASVTEQKKQRPWNANISDITYNLWEDRWEHLEDVKGPLDLFPTQYANACYVHVEMPPVYGYGEDGLRVELAEPMGTHPEDYWFTEKQHKAVVKLAVDLADRNNWPDGWWKTGRLVGHEDVSPYSRSKKAGGWDPGALRRNPRFNWNYVYSEIEKVYSARTSSKADTEAAEDAVKHVEVHDSTEDVARAFVDFVTSLFKRKK